MIRVSRIIQRYDVRLAEQQQRHQTQPCSKQQQQQQKLQQQTQPASSSHPQQLQAVLAGSPSHGGDVTVYVFDKSQQSLPTPFILFLYLFLSLWPFQLYFIPQILPSTLRFLTLFSWSNSALLGLSTIYLFMKVSLSPDIILCG